MPKRFTETGKWDDSWFIDLSPQAKLIWLYFCDKCDNAGVLDLHLRKLSFDTGIDSPETFVKELESRLKTLESGKIWIKNFVNFQYGELKKTSNLHQSVARLLLDHGLPTPIVPIQDPSKTPPVGVQDPSGRGTSKGKGKGKDIGKEEKGRGEKEQTDVYQPPSSSLVDLFPESMKMMSDHFGGPNIARGLLSTLKADGWIDDAVIKRLVLLYLSEIPKDRRQYYPMTSKSIVSTFQKLSTEFAGQKVETVPSPATRARELTSEEREERDRMIFHRDKVQRSIYQMGEIPEDEDELARQIISEWSKEPDALMTFRTIGNVNRKRTGGFLAPCLSCLEWVDWSENIPQGYCKDCGEKK